MWRVAMVCLPMILLLFMVEVAVLAGTRLVYAVPYSDPFAPYEAIMPGQRPAVLDQYPCQFEKGFERTSELTICRMYPSEGIFYEVTVLFNSHRIWRVSFKLRELRLGDLVQRWGYPKVYAHQ